MDPAAEHPGAANRQRHRSLPGTGFGGGARGGIRALEDRQRGRRSPQGGWQDSARADLRRGGRGRDRDARADLAQPQSGPQWRASLETYAYPSMGETRVSEITPGYVMAVLLPIWSEKRETARRVKQRISAICRWAVAQGYRTDDPAGIVMDAHCRTTQSSGARCRRSPTKRWRFASRR